jgi:Plants and Prokaryotes Conserved (PCC) domain
LHIPVIAAVARQRAVIAEGLTDSIDYAYRKGDFIRDALTSVDSLPKCGTLTPDGPHLHISVSDGTGKTIGGHLVEGCPIYTTVEIIIGEAEGIAFTRETDEQTTRNSKFAKHRTKVTNANKGRV